MTISNQSISIGRAALNADVVGNGTPVVFLHAAVADTRMWTAQMLGISSNVKAIAYDRRGFGRTIYPNEDYSSIGDLMAVLDRLGDCRPAILVGCSQGGRIALDAALEYPSRFRGLVMIAPNVPGAPELGNPPEIERLLGEQKDALDAGDVGRVNTIKAHLWLDGPLQPEGRVAGSVRDLLLDMNSIVLRSSPAGLDTDISQISPAFGRLAEVAMPSLMIWGELDFPHIQKRCRLVAETMANCSSLVVAEAAHLPSLDRPDVITTALLEFIASCVCQS